ncbi:hypothetical protein RvY_13161 [Ramazzottius varieornatus]|uniref:Cationic amino acid transporter C-terminal domain-containing protein n=1 Tax=Ramazzottius varieornatus TaxID=947166 RepID=A0A1D1VLY1_RAMVA|nr:hypothetical protein RvY_13161 [Ramazzottius varieornatus]
MDQARHWFGHFWAKLTRRKVIREDLMKTNLKRSLSPVAVIAIGIGQMAGGGAFVVLGPATQYAGPAVVISFAIGALVAFVTGMCYAEFASTIPQAGSGYVFSYVTIGEFVAFIVGWQMVLEELVSAASMSSAISGAIDAMTNNTISEWTINNVGAFDSPYLAAYPDLLALAAGLLITTLMLLGSNRFTFIGTVLSFLGVVFIIFSIIVCFVFADSSNWTSVGFAPYGFRGIMRGAAVTFFAYIGFEGVSSAGEEAANPQRTIPLAMFSSLGIVTVFYLLQSIGLTLVVPYTQIDPQSAFPEAFISIGYPGIGITLAIGIIISLIGGLISNLFTMTRTTYAMAKDGLLFRLFAKVNSYTRSPIYSELIFGALAALLAVIFNLEILVEFLSVGTLCTYTIVAGCSIILHYQTRVAIYDVQQEGGDPTKRRGIAEDDGYEDLDDLVGYGELKSRYRFWKRSYSPYPGFAVDISVVLLAAFAGAFYSVFIYAYDELADMVWWAVLLVVLFPLGFISAFLVITAHKKRRLRLPFQMPSVPLIPAISIALNVLLLSNLGWMSWVRFIVWLTIGESNEELPPEIFSLYFIFFPGYFFLLFQVF